MKDFTPEISSIKYKKRQEIKLRVSFSESIQHIRDFIPQTVALKLSVKGFQTRFTN